VISVFQVFSVFRFVLETIVTNIAVNSFTSPKSQVEASFVTPQSSLNTQSTIAIRRLPEARFRASNRTPGRFAPAMPRAR
jgi:hypothetical protein